MEIALILRKGDWSEVVRPLRIEFLAWDRVDFEFTIVFVEIFGLELGIVLDLGSI